MNLERIPRPISEATPQHLGTQPPVGRWFYPSSL